MPSRCPSNCEGYKEILQLLIDKGANVNAVDNDGRTALDAAFEANESEGRIKNKLRHQMRLDFFLFSIFCLRFSRPRRSDAYIKTTWS